MEGETGAVRDIVTLNAGAGLVVAGLAADIDAGLELANAAIDSGAAGEKLAMHTEASKEMRQ